MLTAAAVFAALAGLLHVYIWAMESLVFTSRGRKVFGLSAEQAADERVRELFYNQGFYNLFLAVGALVGVVLVLTDCAGGRALVWFTTGSMLGAALVLVTHNPKMLRGGVVQGTLPLLALAGLAVDALTR
ncbi:DUF1304 domain-containing protein [Nocardioides jiangxiensis]|uniref:DUF1304 domain-containing protein n=1 Tax=Nocardioides jiangxiensis TaxID=3064524 RepID=A0ABT9B774_9ACTN|nr:DUF1304 domain-containing protein [Nocardioides sp. WY-20]MDO7869432.1 DUF1304 domain-containing protein [Nocardioides sp. WY-20]